MEIRVNTKIISKLNPCKDRLDNWKQHYSDFDSDIVKFLKLDQITFSDKLWVALKLVPRVLIEVFAFDCAVRADSLGTSVYAAKAATAAAVYTAAAPSSDYYGAVYVATTYSANAAGAAGAAGAASDAAEKERQMQIDALIYLITTTSKQDCEGLGND